MLLYGIASAYGTMDCGSIPHGPMSYFSFQPLLTVSVTKAVVCDILSMV